MRKWFRALPRLHIAIVGLLALGVLSACSQTTAPQQHLLLEFEPTYFDRQLDHAMRSRGACSDAPNDSPAGAIVIQYTTDAAGLCTQPVIIDRR